MQTIPVSTPPRNSNPALRGGQAASSLFGLAGITAKHAPHREHPGSRSPRAAGRKPWTSRIKGALNPGDRDGLQPAHYASAAQASYRREEHEWRELADLAACPEWERALPYGGVEIALALD